MNVEEMSHGLKRQYGLVCAQAYIYVRTTISKEEPKGQSFDRVVYQFELIGHSAKHCYAWEESADKIDFHLEFAPVRAATEVVDEIISEREVRLSPSPEPRQVTIKLVELGIWMQRILGGGMKTASLVVSCPNFTSFTSIKKAPRYFEWVGEA